jgi:hypothetical protein
LVYNEETEKLRQECLIEASKLSKNELNVLIDELMEQRKFEEASIFAKIYCKRDS